MLKYVCDVCGRTADYMLPGTWATVQIIVQTPAIPEVLPDPTPIPPNPQPAVQTNHVCDLHVHESVATMTMERKP
jgi:hypothetical protein